MMNTGRIQRADIEAVCRVEQSDFDFNLTIPRTEPCDEAEAARVRDSAISYSRAKYARPRAEIEAELLRKWQTAEPEPANPQPAQARTAEPELPPEPGKPKITKKHGWTIKTVVAKTTPEEAKQLGERATRAIAEALRKKRAD